MEGHHDEAAATPGFPIELYDLVGYWQFSLLIPYVDRPCRYTSVWLSIQVGASITAIMFFRSILWCPASIRVFAPTPKLFDRAILTMFLLLHNTLTTLLSINTHQPQLLGNYCGHRGFRIPDLLGATVFDATMCGAGADLTGQGFWTGSPTLDSRSHAEDSNLSAVGRDCRGQGGVFSAGVAGPPPCA